MNLSPHEAFVVRFYAETDSEADRVVGRVDHVVSHQTATFASLEELWAFMTRVLQQVRTRRSRLPSGCTTTPPACDQAIPPTQRSTER